MMRENLKNTLIKSMRANAVALERAGDYWTAEERDKLRTMFDDGTGISEMALILQRTEHAVTQQVEKLDLYRRKEYPQRNRNPMKAQSCLCGTCQLDRTLCPRYKDCLSDQEDGIYV